MTPIRFTTDIVLFTITSGSTALRGEPDFSREKTIQLQQDTQPFLPEKGKWILMKIPTFEYEYDFMN